MTIDSTSTPPAQDLEQGGVSRRSVVRTGANLAWAVPAISMVSAAPALAVSGKPKLKITSFSAHAGKKSAMIDLGPVKNVGGGDAGQLTAMFDINAKFKKIKVQSVSGGWKTVDGKGPTLTFVTTSTHLESGMKSKPLDVKISYKKTRHPKGSVSVVVKGHGDSASDSTKF